VEANIPWMAPQPHPLGWLHASSRLLQVGRVQSLAVKRVGGVAARRAQQRLEMGRRLLALKIDGWTMTPESGLRFWRALRWGGIGFSLAWLLSHWLS
jgi:hypothetical protein